MRRLRLFAMVLYVCSLCLQAMAQGVRIQTDKKGRAGYVSETGGEILPCKYDAVYSFENGRGKVMKGEKYGLVNEQGKFVIPIKYDELTYDKNGFYRARAGKKWGLISPDGDVILKVAYTVISPFNSYGKARVNIGGKIKDNKISKGKYGIINQRGEFLIPAKYEFLGEWGISKLSQEINLKEKTLCTSYGENDTLRSDCKYVGYGKNSFNAGLLDENGNIIIKQGLYTALLEPKNGMMRYSKTKGKQTTLGYYNLDTRTAMDIGSYKRSSIWSSNIKVSEEWLLGDFNIDIAPVSRNGAYYFIDKKGNKVIDNGYTKVEYNEEVQAYACKKSNNEVDVLDGYGHDLFPGAGFSHIAFGRTADDANYFTVCKTGKWGVVNRSGKELIPFEYDAACATKFGWNAMKKGDAWGMVDLNNTEIVPFQYTEIVLQSEKNPKIVWVVKPDSLYYMFDTEDKGIYTRGYTDVLNFVDGYAWVRPVGLEVEDNAVNRGLTSYATVTDAERKAVLDKNKKFFGLFVNTEGETVFGLPITQAYAGDVRKLLKAKGNRPLTLSEAKGLLLKLTTSDRIYPLKGDALTEENWDF